MEEKRVLIHKHIDIFYCISIITKGDSYSLVQLNHMIMTAQLRFTIATFKPLCKRLVNHNINLNVKKNT